MELAVNMPEHEPHVGHAFSSTSPSWSSLSPSSADRAMASIKSVRCSMTPSTGAPDSMGPPETKIAGMLSRRAAMSIPGVILSQFDMHTSASAVCALTMYSTESAMTSREGSEYSMPEWPIAMPSSTAMVLNSRPTPPASAMASHTSEPMFFRWTCPGTKPV